VTHEEKSDLIRELRAEIERLTKELAFQTDMACQADVACMQLKALLTRAADALDELHKMRLYVWPWKEHSRLIAELRASR
jgi:hypothetical protein